MHMWPDMGKPTTLTNWRKLCFWHCLTRNLVMITIMLETIPKNVLHLTCDFKIVPGSPVSWQAVFFEKHGIEVESTFTMFPYTYTLVRVMRERFVPVNCFAGKEDNTKDDDGLQVARRVFNMLQEVFCTASVACYLHFYFWMHVGGYSTLRYKVWLQTFTV